MVKLVKKYKDHGTTLNPNKEFSGRRRTARTLENVQEVRTELENNPRNVSLRRNNLEILKSSLQRIIKLDIRWHPLKIFILHRLQPGDF